MRNRRSLNNRKGIGGQLIDVTLYLIALFVLFPFIDLFLTTFKDKFHVYDAFYWPDFTYLRNYIYVFKYVNVPAAFGNTIIICASTLALIVIFGSMAGYMISRSKERFFKLVYGLFAAGLIIPTQTAMIVIYKLGVYIHLINTIPFLVLIYASGSAAFASLIYAGFTKNIPKEMEEAATIDGCGIYKTFFRIIFPLLMPATGTVLVTTIFWFWNDFSGPLIYLNGKTQTIIMAIFTFSMQNQATDWGPVFTLCFIASLPIILFFLFTQKYLIKGLVAGAIKG